MTQLTLIKSAVETQATTIKDLKGSIEETTLRSKDLKAAVDNINSSQASIVKGIKELKEKSDEVKKFLSNTVPPELNRMLQDYRSGKASPPSTLTRTGTVLSGSIARGSFPD